MPPTSVPPTSKPVPPTATPVPGQPCSPATAQGLSFTYNEAGEHCWTFSATPAYINSWNLNRLEVNGVDLTNAFGCGSHFEASD